MKQQLTETTYLYKSLRCLFLSAYYLCAAIVVMLQQVVCWIYDHLRPVWIQAVEMFREYRTICILSIVIVIMAILQVVSICHICNLRTSQDLIELNQLHIVHESDSIRQAQIKYSRYHSNI